jgi:hypothetical protein
MCGIIQSDRLDGVCRHPPILHAEPRQASSGPDSANVASRADESGVPGVKMEDTSYQTGQLGQASRQGSERRQATSDAKRQVLSALQAIIFFLSLKVVNAEILLLRGVELQHGQALGAWSCQQRDASSLLDLHCDWRVGKSVASEVAGGCMLEGGSRATRRASIFTHRGIACGSGGLSSSEIGGLGLTVSQRDEDLGRESCRKRASWRKDVDELLILLPFRAFPCVRWLPRQWIDWIDGSRSQQASRPGCGPIDRSRRRGCCQAQRVPQPAKVRSRRASNYLGRYQL